MTKLIIEGMTCDHCVRAVSQALAKVPGVARVERVVVGEAVVEEGSAKPAELLEAVRDAGYEVRVAP